MVQKKFYYRNYELQIESIRKVKKSSKKIKKKLKEKEEATLRRKAEAQISPRLQYIMDLRRNGEIPFERLPNENESVPIL